MDIHYLDFCSFFSKSDVPICSVDLAIEKMFFKPAAPQFAEPLQGTISVLASLTCSPYSGTGSSTDVGCSFTVCGSNVIVANTSPGYGGTCSGDTYLYLYTTSGTLLTQNDDYQSLCSYLTYTQTNSGCVSYRLKQSCFGSSYCSGTSYVSYTPVTNVSLLRIFLFLTDFILISSLCF